MFFTAALVLFGLMGMVTSNSVCLEKSCKPAKRFELLPFRHISDLQNSSVAPWTLKPGPDNGEYIQTIPHAVCTTCTVDNMIAKPIYLEIQVLKSMGHGVFCRCPYKLAVGCTCVNQQ